MKRYFHRLLCYFSVTWPKKAFLCFGEFSDFYLQFLSGEVYKLFPKTTYECLFADSTSNNLQLKKDSIQHIAYVRMLCIWDLYENSLDLLLSKEFEHSEIAYMIGIIMDTHIPIVTNPDIQHIHHVYKRKLAPDQFSLVEFDSNRPYIWSQEMVRPDRIQHTMELLWIQEITIVFGPERVSSSTVRAGERLPKTKNTIQKDINLLKKGLPRPTSIRYITAQITKGLDQCHADVSKGIPALYPCILIMLMCNYLGAYKNSVSIAHPDHRIKAYTLKNVTDILALVGKSLTSSQLYNIVAEFIIAWSEEHSSLVHLLRRMSFWKDHKQSILWQCNFVMQPFRGIASNNILKHTPSRRFGLAPLRRRMTHTYEFVNTKNIMFFICKTMGLRKRVPQAIMKALKARKIDIAKIYKCALYNVERYCLDENILNKMGLSWDVLKEIKQIIESKTIIRSSKIATSIITALKLPHQRAIFYMYLHALRERCQFMMCPAFGISSSSRNDTTVMICMSCLSIRTKGKGEKDAHIRNSGIMIDLCRHKAYCASCNSDAIQSIDIKNKILQVSTTHTNKAPNRVVLCSQCNCALYTTSVTVMGTSVYCKECFKKKSTTVPHSSSLLCGCVVHNYRHRNTSAYIHRMAYDEHGRLRQYSLCEKHAKEIPHSQLYAASTIQKYFSLN